MAVLTKNKRRILNRHIELYVPAVEAIGAAEFSRCIMQSHLPKWLKEELVRWSKEWRR